MELLHSTERKFNTEISELIKAVKGSSVSDVNVISLGKLCRAPLADLVSLSGLLESNMEGCCKLNR